jgi:hypothetical protein
LIWKGVLAGERWSKEGVGTYATVGTVCAAALLGGLVDLDVLDDQVGGVKTLGVGVGLGVLEEREDELGRLDGPAGLGDTELLAFGMYQYVCSLFPGGCSIPICILAAGRLTLGGAASAPGITSHGDGLGVVLDVLEVLEGTGDLPAVDGLSGLAGVLERDTEVGTASAGALGVLDFGSGVTDLEENVLVGCRFDCCVCEGAHFDRAVN